MGAKGEKATKKKRDNLIFAAGSYLLINLAVLYATITWAPAYAWWVCALLVAVGFVTGNLATDALMPVVEIRHNSFWADLAPVALAAVAGWVGSLAIAPWVTTILLLDLLGLVAGVFMRATSLYITHGTIAQFVPRIDRSRLN